MGVTTTSQEVTPKLRDARRNIELILHAAEACLARDPDASMGDIAAEAGLGRVTIYGHFASPGPDRGGGSPHVGRWQRGA